MQANSQSSREYNYCFVSQDAYVWGFVFFFSFGTDKNDDDNIVRKEDQNVSQFLKFFCLCLLSLFMENFWFLWFPNLNQTKHDIQPTRCSRIIAVSLMLFVMHSVVFFRVFEGGKDERFQQHRLWCFFCFLLKCSFPSIVRVFLE